MDTSRAATFLLRPLFTILVLVMAGAAGVAVAQTPMASIQGLIQLEGNGGTEDFVFTVTLNLEPTVETTVDWATRNGTAVAPDDYAVSSGTVVFAIGQTTSTLTVPVVADRVYENNEVFYVDLSNPVNCTIQGGNANGWILNDDVRVSVAGLTQDEGQTGTTDFIFAVTLSGTYDVPVSVDWATVDGSAVAPDDFVASTGTVDFPVGETSATVTVQVVGDRVYESQEYFRVVLSDPVNCTIHTGSAYGWIGNDDVRVSVADVMLDEGNAGTTDYVFALTLSGAYDVPVSVDWTTANNSAVAPGDYATTAGTANFPVGETVATAIVQVVGDREYEAQEYFRVVLSNPVNVSIHDGTGYGWINNDDVRLIVANLAQDEGSAGTTDFVFTATLSATYEFPVSVDWVTADGSALSPDDYAASSGTINIAIGETMETFVVPVVGDLYREYDENFTVHLSSPVNCSLGSSTVNASIRNDDDYPAIGIGDVSAVEGHTGTTTFQFPVTLSSDYVELVQVYYNTVEGSALAPEDYEHVADRLSIPIGETEAFITVNVVGDYEVEPDESFELVLFSPTHGTIGDGTGVGTIENDDLGVALLVDDVTDLEGDSGSTEYLFDVTLAEASLATVSVDWTTVDGTAFAGEDYVAALGTLTFPAGETLRTVPVSVLGDVFDECTEEFYVELSNAVNATIFDGQGIGTIQHDDLAGCVNADGDCYHDESCGGRDCDDSDPSVYPGAPEVNDGVDNQCPGSAGFGVIDEISGVCGFHDGDSVRFSWPLQSGAAAYEMARSGQKDFLTICDLWPPTSLPHADDVSDPSSGECFYYLVRPATPLSGSWGATSTGVERVFTCPNP